MFRTFKMFSALATCLLMHHLASHVSADLYTDGYIDPAWQGEANTTYQEWTGGFNNVFTNAPTLVNNPNPGVNNAGNNPSATGAFITSTMGIYSFNQLVRPTVTVANYGLGDDYITTLRWQVSIDRIGQWLDLNTATVTPEGGSPISLAANIEWVSRVYNEDTGEWEYPTVETTTSGTGTYLDLGFFQGEAGGYGVGPDFTKGYLFEWTIPGNVESYTFNISALGSSLSFKGAQVNTWTRSVPEPSSLALLSLVSLGIGYRRRARRQ